MRLNTVGCLPLCVKQPRGESSDYSWAVAHFSHCWSSLLVAVPLCSIACCFGNREMKRMHKRGRIASCCISGWIEISGSVVFSHGPPPLMRCLHLLETLEMEAVEELESCCSISMRNELGYRRSEFKSYVCNVLSLCSFAPLVAIITSVFQGGNWDLQNCTLLKCKVFYNCKILWEQEHCFTPPACPPTRVNLMPNLQGCTRGWTTATHVSTT